MALHGARMSNANAIPEEEATAAVLSIWDTKILRVKKPQAILALRDCDLYTKNRDLAQAVLMILEHELKSSRGRGGAGFSNWDGSCTVEHILPQDPSKWLRPAGLWTKPEHRDCLHKLGNLCLLNQSDNSKVRNKGYREKVAILQGGAWCHCQFWHRTDSAEHRDMGSGRLPKEAQGASVPPSQALAH